MSAITEFKIVTTVTIPMQRVRDLLCCAMEGGSNYWAEITTVNLADGLTIADFHSGGKMQPPDDYYHWTELIPTTAGCSLTVADKEGDQPPVKLDLAAIEKGLNLMESYHARHHWNNFIKEDDDAETGDVFLQLCLYGEVIYG